MSIQGDLANDKFRCRLALSVVLAAKLAERNMQLTRSTIESCIVTLPDLVDPEEVMYRLYPLEKIEAGEKDLLDGKLHTHEDVVGRFSAKWRK
jgi:hypothetical protein